MNKAMEYIKTISTLVETVATTQAATINKASTTVSEALKNGGLFQFGKKHRVY